VIGGSRHILLRGLQIFGVLSERQVFAAIGIELRSRTMHTLVRISRTDNQCQDGGGNRSNHPHSEHSFGLEHDDVKLLSARQSLALNAM
jgi:hypothetical protein